LKYFFSFYIVLIVVVASVNTSCKKSTLLSTGNLEFSKDTVVFDTVFTTIGSTTKQLKIYNKSNRTVLISEVQLMGGSSSPFRMNLDGLMGTNFADLELEGGDSLFTFIEVTLNPNGGNLPMVIEDSIRFRTNGVDQYVILAAWGQDMYYHYSDLENNILDTNEGIWPNDKPHLIYGGAFIYENKTLTIQQNTHIYLHKNAVLYNFKGTLNINGTKEEPVTFQGDRLEEEFEDDAGQYRGLYFKEAKTSTLNYIVVKNALTGIHIEGDGAGGSNPTVILQNSKIHNSAYYGVFNFLGGKFNAENSIISHSVYHGFFNLAGAGFNFNHCNVLGYSSGENPVPAFAVTDNYNGTVVPITGNVKNTVIYGNLDSEVVLDLPNAGNSVLFEYCLLKRSPAGVAPIFGSGMLWNQDPAFKNITLYDFEYWSTSPMINAGTVTSLTTDLKGSIRTGVPDISAYEF
jgi:hypothetical protein